SQSWMVMPQDSNAQSRYEKSREEQNQENLELKQTVGLLSLLFRYSDTKDALLMTLGTIGCVADGSSTPLIMLVLSRIMNKYSAHSDLTLHNVNEVGFTYWIDIDKPNILRILEAQRGIPWTNRASLIFEMIERVPSIDGEEQEGKIIQEFRGELEFKDVDFVYPSRPGILGGEILLDSTNIRRLQLTWLRSQMGLVSQEPIHFETSIKENILLGKPSASMEEVISASKAANAHNFISQLPDGYDTHVGHFGIQMSGGQKQRISIARALLRDPKILLLDEATSALDSQSEKIVQDALDQVSIGRTTIIVAHRLSTLRNASLIAVIQSGQVVEAGSHDQLIHNKHGQYSAMVQLQQLAIEDEDSPLTAPENNKDSSPTYFLGNQKHIEGLDKVFSPEVPDSDNKGNHQREENPSTPSLWSLMKMTTPEWKRTLFGCTTALCFGTIQPIHSFCMGALLSAYFVNDPDVIRSEAKLFCFAFIFYAILTLMTNIIQHYNFGVTGEHLTKRIREEVLAKSPDI
ncbi:hypothetical protein IFM89_017923, partial [Coptis chinensis]